MYSESRELVTVTFILFFRFRPFVANAEQNESVPRHTARIRNLQIAQVSQRPGYAREAPLGSHFVSNGTIKCITVAYGETSETRWRRSWFCTLNASSRHLWLLHQAILRGLEACKDCLQQSQKIAVSQAELQRCKVAARHNLLTYTSALKRLCFIFLSFEQVGEHRRKIWRFKLRFFFLYTGRRSGQKRVFDPKMFLRNR